VKPDPLAFIKISQNDFETAKILFEKGLYPQAIYMLQRLGWRKLKFAFKS